MIHIRVKLFATLRKYAPGQGAAGAAFDLDLPDSSTLRDVTKLLRMPEEEVRICFVNGTIQEVGFVLQERDEVGIFPPIGGG